MVSEVGGVFQAVLATPSWKGRSKNSHLGLDLRFGLHEDQRNETAKSFVWTATGQDILEIIDRARETLNYVKWGTS